MIVGSTFELMYEKYTNLSGCRGSPGVSISDYDTYNTKNKRQLTFMMFFIIKNIFFRSGPNNNCIRASP